jgi:phage tail sheath protein FI
MPGVNVTTAARSGGPSVTRAPSGRLFLVGLAERGSTAEPVLLRGMADYEELLGARVAYGALYDSLRLFFEEGGVEAYVARVVGAASTVGTLSLVDRAGAPLNTLKVDAANPGSWSSRMTVQVMDGSLADTFRLVVRLDGDVVADRNNLRSPSQAAIAFAGSPYVKVTDLGSASAAPNNNPKVAAAVPLSAGGDDRAAVTSATYLAALDRFTQGHGDGAVAIPGQGTAVHSGLVAHAEANRRIALLSLAAGQDDEAYVAAAASIDSDAAGLFGPWVAVSDDAGGFRYISPEGFVAGARARAHEQVGPWRAPGGEISVARSILGLETEWTRTQGDDLDGARVSVIRRVAGSIRLYGWRSLSTDEDNFALLSGRDVLNRLVVEGEARLEAYVFAPIDAKGQLLSAVNASLVGIVEPMKQAGGLYPLVDDQGNELDPGYRVETGSSVNTAQTLAQNKVKARLSVRVAPTGALVELTIVKVGPLAGL